MTHGSLKVWRIEENKDSDLKTTIKCNFVLFWVQNISSDFGGLSNFNKVVFISKNDTPTKSDARFWEQKITKSPIFKAIFFAIPSLYGNL